MKRKLAAIVVALLLVGTFGLLQCFSRSAQARWAASATPQPGVAAAIPLDRHRYGAAVLQQFGDADKHIAAGEMTGASAIALAEARVQVSNERHLVLFRSIEPRRDSQETANVAQSYAEVAQRRACFRAVSCGFGLNPRLPGRGTLLAEAFGGRDRWITDVTR